MIASAKIARSRGFTLIELMVAVVVSSIVVLGIFAFSSIQQSNVSVHERNVRIQQSLEGAMWAMGQDVRHAGLGFARACTELRVWDNTDGRVINPGAQLDPTLAARDLVTGEAFWVLRDGLQAFWNSSNAADLAGGGVTSSSSPESAADGFDVIVAEPSYVQSFGVFTLQEGIDSSDLTVAVNTSALLDNTDPLHLEQVRQLFPPGTFFVVARTPGTTSVPLRPEAHGQCALLQVTGDVEPSNDSENRWVIPIDPISGFNANLDALLGDGSEVALPVCPDEPCPTDDWTPSDPPTDNTVGSSIIPLGRLRWSRYEIDYTSPTQPYLVRYDIIGYQNGVDPGGLGSTTNYPHCISGECQAPQLHLPGSTSPPLAVAIGPMVEDLQVAVACDGYTDAGAGAATIPIRSPDPGYVELGPAEGANAGIPNGAIDENRNESGQRNVDEWVGNAQSEESAPDCVWYGTGEWARDEWAAVDSDSSPPPAFRMSPQAIRLTVVGSTEMTEQSGGLAVLALDPIEDRPSLDSPVGVRQRFALTERFTPDNLRWRDPMIE